MDHKNIKQTAVNTPFFTSHEAEIQIHQPWAETLPSDWRSTTVRLANLWILVASWISFNLWIYNYIQALIILYLLNMYSFGAKCNFVID
jgi:hypothetical protein